MFFEVHSRFRICICTSAKGWIATAKIAVERFAVIRMNIIFVNILNGWRMFRLRFLIFWTFRTFFMSLGAFVF
ncbi:hypothetical protein Cenrod_0236 [Candidatus Symbiobacter mobilis CR]|uniref:Uncharacterized protein n=1 Tax=Candidatus Symbiobacter mobilis CR TaxID=946483 RepID=U5N7Y4_9BURK|nr:hypothetical protein Cenrod_0236 [Candidatus Symbiobacter mobilis CR]